MPDTTTPARRAGRPQGFLLMFMSCLPILGAVLLAPVLPRMQDHFGHSGAATALVPLSLTVPALMIALLAPFAGRIVDRFGRKRLLLIGLAVYAVFGTAPLWLDGLGAIVLSRAGVGVAEAAIMTCCTTLISDYFSGTERDRWLGMQTVFASLSATLFFALGGALGAQDWRNPFWLYASSLVFLVLAAALIWPPAGESASAEEHAPLPPLPTRALALPCAVTVVGGIVFYTPIVELPYVLDAAGITAVPAIGAFAALASLATASGAYAFGRVSGRGTATLLPIAFGLAGIGLVVLGATSVVPVIVLGAVIASAGTGLMLPTLLVWALSGLTFEQRGRGTGLWTAALFLGEFVCPLLVVAFTGALGGLGAAVGLVGAVALVLAIVTRRVLTRALPVPA
ncbi:MFS transporter [Nocardioides albus]|uniref:Putative MFS family arabinose efflux permease n=1 Tax=Nocardioides albus TaxID=1841 RepID=A0A7W5A4R4_9ACTN|nr:MFS transporter [Nocardioides albus]MBB3089249.1 putative MFS family arabinose efflux permease [Nocardioides albus]GGU13248.1 MFS transporter [Nocardioides albus]